jgi:hypothetical protein
LAQLIHRTQSFHSCGVIRDLSMLFHPRARWGSLLV